VDIYTRSAAAVLRSADDQALDSLPDNDIKSAMQALPQRFRDVVYYADVEGSAIGRSRQSRTPRPEQWLRSFTVADDNCAGRSAKSSAMPEPRHCPSPQRPAGAVVLQDIDRITSSD
jgi:hypothetical protein